MRPPIRQYVKDVTGSNVWLRYSFLAPWRVAYALKSAITKSNVSGRHQESLEWRRKYAETVFQNYKTFAGIDCFHGRVAEVGPGEVAEVASLLLADGCSSVDQVDRFHHRDTDDRIRCYRAEAETFFDSNKGYDFILSCAVMEHLRDPLRALRSMVHALNPGGIMVHVIDCRDHGQFSDSMHDLSFLRIPPVLYTPLTLASGLNRIRLSSYIKAVEDLRIEYRVLITSLAGLPKEASGLEKPLPFSEIPEPLIEQSMSHLSAIRNQLAKRFRDLPEQDLIVSGFVLTCYAPAEPKRREAKEP